MPEHLLFGEHLTKAPHDAAIRDTYLGQAHIAGTGPEGKTCRECVFWHKWKVRRDSFGNIDRVPAPPGYFGKRHPEMPLCLKKAACNKPILNKAKRLIPHDAKACRLFEQADNPPPIKRVEK